MEAALSLEALSYYNEQEVLDKLRISQSTLWRYKKQEVNPFPQPIWLGRNVYLESEISAWLLANRRG